MSSNRHAVAADQGSQLEREITITHNHIADYINHHLTRNGFEWTECPPLRPPNAFNRSMRVLGDMFEQKYQNVFSEMSTQLHITPASAYATFTGVTDELFVQGITWGRIVALFTFGGAIATQAMNKEMPCLVSKIVDWCIEYIDTFLMDWIITNGSWDGLTEYYDVVDLDQRKVTTWSMRNFFCGMAAGALGVLTIGAILTSHS